MKNILSLLLAFVIISTASLFPGSLPDSSTSLRKVDIAKVSSTRLQQKILLSDEQTLKVKEILNDYLKKNSSAESNLASVQDKISGMLDQKQKAKFEIIKNEWWNSFIKEVKKVPAK